MMLVDVCQLTWKLVVQCTEGCIPSQKALTQFMLLIIYNAVTMYLLIILLTYVATRLVFAAIGLIRGLRENAGLAYVWATAVKYTWPPARTRLLRDCLLTAIYISIMAFIVLSPGSPGYSFSMNGQQIIVGGQFTEYGLHRALRRFFRYCVEGFIFFVFCRSFDHFVHQRRSS